MPKIKFFDVKAKKSFMSDKFEIRIIKGRKFAVTTSPLTGIQAFTIVAEDFKK